MRSGPAARRYETPGCPRCGEVVRDRVPAGYSRAKSIRRGWRLSYFGRRWECGRPARHVGPHLPRLAEADQTDVLLARWQKR